MTSNLKPTKLVDFGVQYCIGILEEQPSFTLDMFETETESECCQESDLGR